MVLGVGFWWEKFEFFELDGNGLGCSFGQSDLTGFQKCNGNSIWAKSRVLVLLAN